MQFRIIIMVISILAGFALSMAPVRAEEVKEPGFSDDKAAVKSRMDNVRNLVNTSSGAKRVQQGSEEAKSLRKQATEHLARAETLFEKGDMETANSALHDATIAMFQAIRSVGSGKAGRDKLMQDYRNKRSSLDALLEALKRVAEEKNIDPEGVSKITAQALEADSLADTGNLQQARVLLDKSYDSVKLEVEKLRSGDTLVRSLEFASKEEEYAYELDRNDTHQMLVKLLLEDKQLDSQGQGQVDAFLAEAKQLRGRAEQQSAEGGYEKGIELLEESTKQIVRAIRRAGVYIPG